MRRRSYYSRDENPDSSEDEPRRFPFHSRPGWWPENEAWPPRRHYRRSPFYRRLGCLFVFVPLIGFGLFVFAFVSLAQAFGLVVFSSGFSHRNVPLGIGFLVFFAALVILVAFWIKRISMPLDDLLSAADRVADGDTSVRVPEKGPREVRSLARAFNNMASRLHRTDEQRRELMADVTHELRTPLTVIQGNLEGMLDGVYPADEANLRSLLDETNVISKLVEDLRTLALAEAGALQLKREPTDLAHLTHDTLNTFRPQAQAAGVTLDVEVAGDLPALELDPGRMRQVLSNLLANALRYTPSGGTVRVACERIDKQVRLEVRDSGPGIPPSDLPHVFERFYKSTDSGGMGLGLAIARHLVEAQGGTISAESQAGQGTTIRIEIPLE